MGINANEYSIVDLIILVVKKEISIDEIVKKDLSEDDIEKIKEYTHLYYYDNEFPNEIERFKIRHICKEVLDSLDHKRIFNAFEEKTNTSVNSQHHLTLDWNDLEDDDTSVDNVYDGLILSLCNKAKVDIPYISKITGIDENSIIKELDGLIYQNPDTWNEEFNQGYETSDTYLSGNLALKLKSAEDANKKYPGLFDKNIETLKRICPKPIDYKDIFISLGSPWIPTDIIDDFIAHLLGGDAKEIIMTKHENYSGSWDICFLDDVYGGIDKVYRVKHSSINTMTWGTSRFSALKLIELSLNMKKAVAYDTVYGTKANGTYGDVLVLNKDETTFAQEKQSQIINEFKDWVWKDEDRKKRLIDIYYEKYCSFVKRKYDGSFLTFPGMNEDVKLYDYQKNAVARILFSKNVLLAHDVGSGKTYEMIAAAMELRRIGISRKNMFVVPNNIVGQWEEIFRHLYPNANILIINSKNFSSKNRQKTLKIIRDNDFDGIIIPYSSFDKLSLTNKKLIEQLSNELLKIENERSLPSSNVDAFDKKIETLKKKITKLQLEVQNNKEIYFDELGITRIFLDEAHNYKNIPLQTKLNYVLGINAEGSVKSKNMLDKVATIQNLNDGAGLIMATGTPVTNSLTDVYYIQLMLQRGTLNALDIEAFDSWAGMFGEITTDYEIDVASNTYRVASRFSKFHNLPELTSILSQVCDFHRLDNEEGIPDFGGYSDEQINKTDYLQEVLSEITIRAEKVRNKLVNRKEDNMLMITNDGRKAALDLRLIDEHKYTFDKELKVAKCAKNIFIEYCNGNEDKTTQLVFCDISTPKQGFNLYDELSNLLINMGIPKKEIAYVHDATSDKEKNELYEKVRKGDVRILIGSTFKLGIGVNVQDKIKCLHHLDIPWRPADMAQREGRILRKGNVNKTVNIYRYVTEGSFDAYSWQLLETKQRFISDLLSGMLENRDESDINDVVLSYAEIKALAIGNSLIKERVETINEIQRLKILKDATYSVKENKETELKELPFRIGILEKTIKNAKEDYEYILSLDPKKDEELTKEEKETIQIERRELREKIDIALSNNILFNVERELLEYQGFKLILPKNMSKDKPYLYLQRLGKYPVEMGESQTGNLIRIDNFINGFDKTLRQYENSLENLYLRKEELEKFTTNEDEIAQAISQLIDRLNIVNERLGLNNE